LFFFLLLLLFRFRLSSRLLVKLAWLLRLLRGRRASGGVVLLSEVGVVVGLVRGHDEGRRKIRWRILDDERENLYGVLETDDLI
jgi:hypothetical protein